MRRPPRATGDTIRDFHRILRVIQENIAPFRDMLRSYPIVIEELGTRFVMENEADLTWFIAKLESAIAAFLDPPAESPLVGRLFYEEVWFSLEDEADIAWFEARLAKMRKRLEKTAASTAA